MGPCSGTPLYLLCILVPSPGAYHKPVSLSTSRSCDIYGSDSPGMETEFPRALDFRDASRRALGRWVEPSYPKVVGCGSQGEQGSADDVHILQSKRDPLDHFQSGFHRNEVFVLRAAD